MMRSHYKEHQISSVTGQIRNELCSGRRSLSKPKVVNQSGIQQLFTDSLNQLQVPTSLKFVWPLKAFCMFSFFVHLEAVIFQGHMKSDLVCRGTVVFISFWDPEKDSKAYQIDWNKLGSATVSYQNCCGEEQVPQQGLQVPFRDGLLKHVAQDVYKLSKVCWSFAVLYHLQGIFIL